jgi:hypothetical protein
MNRSVRIAGIGALLGLIAGFLTGCTLTLGTYFGGSDVVWANWQPLGMPPDKPTRIQSVVDAAYGSFGLLVTTADNKGYFCCDRVPFVANWQPIDAQGNFDPSYGFLTPVDSIQKHRLVTILNIPSDAVDIAYNYRCLGWCGTEYDYVIRADGTVWAWTEHIPGTIGLSDSSWLGGALLGLIVGIGWARFTKPKLPKATSDANPSETA